MAQPAMRLRPRGWARRGLLVLLMILAVILGWVVAGVVFFGLATTSSTVELLLAGAVAAGLAAGTAGGWSVARVLSQGHPRRSGLAVGTAGTAVLIIVAVSTVLRPLPSTPTARQPAQAPAAVHYWHLSTGSRLAYLKIPATGTPALAPIVIVGGGPGEEDVADTAQTRFFGQLASLGYNVYFYDQLGAGLSTRLADPAGYTVARHVADLDAIRRRLGATQMILLGSSWGGSLVASYMAHHPRRVAKAIFTSPAPIDYAQWPSANWTTSRLPPRQRQRAERLLPDSSRFALWYALGEVNAQAAHHLVSDREADSFFNTYLGLVRPATVCTPAHLPRQRESGNGFYDNIFTTRDARTSDAQAPVRPALRHEHSPVLILTGGCNYIPWAVTAQYKTTLPNSTLVCLPNAGHVIYLDEPSIYASTIRAFLRDRPLPVPARNTATPCTPNG